MNAQNQAGARGLRFGVFELDLAARELRKRGVRVRLQDQPFRVLEALLEKPGEIVTREQLKDRLWAQDEFVEFDKSLNTAVQKIRQALDDSAESPRFLETVPRQGYCFIAPVERPTAEPPQASKSRRLNPALVAAVIVVIAAASWVLSTRSAPPEPPRDVFRLTNSARLAFQPAISSDGSLLAYASNENGNLDIWVKHIPGGSPVQVTHHSADDSNPSFSPNAESIVFRSERDGGGIYAVPAFGGAEPRLIAAQGRWPRYSPDGERIAYWTGAPHAVVLRTSAVYVVKADGSDAKRFEGLTRPIWSPDGKHLLTSGNAIWTVIDLESGERTQLQASETFEAQGLEGSSEILESPFVADQWLAEGIVFSAYSNQASAVFRIPFSAKRGFEGAPERLTFGAAQASGASTSQRGGLVFGNTRLDRDIYRIPIEANAAKVVGEIERVVASARGEWPSSATRDGRLLAYAVQHDGGTGVWLRDLKAGATRELRSGPEELGGGRVSWDGSQVVYRNTEEQALYRIPAAGGPPERICTPCGYPNDWTPDASAIVFYGGTTLRHLNLATRETSVLLADDQGRVLADAMFSPDGRWLAFHRIDAPAKKRQLFVTPYRPDATLGPAEWIAVAPAGRNDFRAGWSPDGNVIYFGSEHEGFWCVYARRFDREQGRPIGELMPIYHSHDPQRNILATGNPGHAGFIVVEDGIFITLAERTGNIWMQERGDGE